MRVEQGLEALPVYLVAPLIAEAAVAELQWGGACRDLRPEIEARR